MPTVSQQPIDIQWSAVLASSATVYTGKQAALVAAVALSAANSNLPVQMLRILETVSAKGSTGLAQVDMPGSGIPLWLVQLASTVTVYPLETARVSGYATSASNSNGAVYIASVEEVVAAP